ncbi:hypothetical protein CPT03_05265 [Pedobacter ginsengisoli]|uniref:Organic solvent tolerance-like N-terminal domain-containing protein n=1 Tax=Pedobacter ginsengisoli TaxID=363852 RepID=A0A2D1U2U2_9SPHI|nr:hypothetical protein [Pedobacter ginsengisoli]ATP55915.1 hypothetical protein CPT03_05265 [Pedobacter ginsengisoli]
MKRKLTFLLGLLLCYSLFSKSQTLTSAHFRISDREKGIRSVELNINNTIIIGLNSQGDISYIEEAEGALPDYTSDLEYTDDGGSKLIANQKIEYYDHFDDNKSGKVKWIGGIKIDYNDNFDIHDPKGKIKSIGNIQIKYNNAFDIHDKSGTMKSIGPIQIKYNNVFDIHDPADKVKSIGNVKITYFNAFDAQRLFGKIKSIKGNSKKIYVTK